MHVKASVSIDQTAVFGTNTRPKTEVAVLRFLFLRALIILLIGVWGIFGHGYIFMLEANDYRK